MDTIHRLASSWLRSSPFWQRLFFFRWDTAGIRTKMLVPLIILMLLSILGSSIGFLISTTNTRDNILTRQLDDQESRLRAALAEREREAIEAISLLPRDDQLVEFLRQDRIGEGIPTRAESIQGSKEPVLEAQSRVTIVRDRFELDQVIILNAQRQTRVNIAPSYLEPITVDGSDVLPPCSSVERHLGSFGDLQLLIFCTPMFADNHSETPYDRLATAYAVLDLSQVIQRTRRDLELTADITLLESRSTIATTATAESASHLADTDENGVQSRVTNVALGDGMVTLLLQISKAGSDEIVTSGLRVTLISSGLTLVVLLFAVAWLARGFTRPILKLADVAQSVAEGDLTRRANLKQHDEIGLLGRSLDQATTTIMQLLDQQERTTSEREAILQSIADGVLAVDQEERILIMNPAAATLLHQPAEAMIGQPLSTMQLTDDPVLVVGLQQLVNQLRSELTDKDFEPTEELVSLGNRIVRLQSAPTFGSGGSLTGAVIVIQDITRMVESDRAKSEFIATASHELRTPLTSLKGFVDILVSSGTDNLNEHQRLCIETVKRQTENLTQLVNDLLEMARLEQGQQRLERRWIDPHNTIEEVIASLASIIKNRQVTVHVNLSPDLPPIWIDTLHLRRILANIISNAVKYVYSGGEVFISAYEIDDPAQLPSAPTADLPWSHKEDRSLVIAVEDNGVGIRATDQDKIFTRFFRAENPLSVEVGGTGLGLAITRSLVEVNHGQIGFRSVEEQGSCFWVRLPTPSTAPVLDESDTPDTLDTTPVPRFVEMGTIF